MEPEPAQTEVGRRLDREHLELRLDLGVPDAPFLRKYWWDPETDRIYPVTFGRWVELLEGEVERPSRRVGYTAGWVFGRWVGVSTVFLGVPHLGGTEALPAMFETMVNVDGSYEEHDLYVQRRYQLPRDARRGHAEVVRWTAWRVFCQMVRGLW